MSVPITTRSPARLRPSTVATIATSVTMAGIVGIAWLWLVGEAETMSSMVEGLAQAGRAMPFDMSTPAFMAMWTTMMVAMMLPSVAPLVLASSKERSPLVATSSRVVLLSGYLLVWVVTGVPALIAVRALNDVGHASASLDRVGGAVLVVAGAYQFTRAKRASLRVYHDALRSPTTSTAGSDPVASARAGLHQGLCCVACCGVLMAVLLAAGVMNLVWMGAITVVCFAEMNWRRGPAVTRLAGLTLIGLGLAVLLHPALLTALAPSP
jgi:predicted metal-binding membrane protein